MIASSLSLFYSSSSSIDNNCRIRRTNHQQQQQQQRSSSSKNSNRNTRASAGNNKVIQAAFLFGNSSKRTNASKEENNNNKTKNSTKQQTNEKKTIKVPIVGVDISKPAMPKKVQAIVSGNERTIAFIVASLTIVKIRLSRKNKGRRGSVDRLEQRGMLDENREVDEEKFFKGMMKSVRTVDMPELTEKQIMAARERRRASRAGDANLADELASIEIPANHPFASNEKLDATQEAERKKKIIDANAPKRKRGVPNQK
jgi:hypothetical protein